MNIVPFILDVNNTAVAGKKSIGRRIGEKGRVHLWNERRLPVIDTVVIHYASAAEADPAHPYDLLRIAQIFCELCVSSHYLIDRRGRVFRLVPEEKRAWHCGGSIMPAPDERRGVNDFSLGIELIATESSGFTKKQFEALLRLCRDIEKRYGKKMRYVGHDAIAGKRAVQLGLREAVKVDPGSMFDWGKFREGLENGRQERGAAAPRRRKGREQEAGR